MGEGFLSSLPSLVTTPAQSNGAKVPLAPQRQRHRGHSRGETEFHSHTCSRTAVAAGALSQLSEPFKVNEDISLFSPRTTALRGRERTGGGEGELPPTVCHPQGRAGFGHITTSVAGSGVTAQQRRF